MEPASKRHRPQGAPQLGEAQRLLEPRLLAAFKKLADPLLGTMRISASTASALRELQGKCRSCIEALQPAIDQGRFVMEFGEPQNNGLKHDGQHVCFIYLGWERLGMASHVARKQFSERLHKAFIPLAHWIVLKYVELRLFWHDPSLVKGPQEPTKRHVIVHFFEEGSLELRVRLAVLVSLRGIQLGHAKDVMDAAAGDGGADAAIQLLEKLACTSSSAGGSAGRSSSGNGSSSSGSGDDPGGDAAADWEDDGELFVGEWEEEAEETWASFSAPLDLQADSVMEYRTRQLQLCSPDAFAGLADDFWDADDWGPLQTFLLGRLLGDGHRKSSEVSMSAQFGDVGALLQMLWMVGGLKDERCPLTFQSRVWKGREKRLPNLCFVTTASIRDANFSAGLKKYIPIGNKHHGYTTQHGQAVKEIVQSTGTSATLIMGFYDADGGLSKHEVGERGADPRIAFAASSRPLASALATTMHDCLAAQLPDITESPALTPSEDTWGHKSLKFSISGRWHVSGIIERSCLEVQRWLDDWRVRNLPVMTRGALIGIDGKRTLSGREACLAYRLLVPRKVWAIEDGTRDRWLIDVQGWSMEPAVLVLKEEDHSTWFEMIRTGRGAKALPYGNVAYFPIAVDPQTGHAFMDQPSLHLLLGYRDNSKLKKATASSSETEDAELDPDRNRMLHDTKLRVSYLGEGLPPGVRLVRTAGSTPAPMFNIQTACFKLNNSMYTLCSPGLTTAG